MSETTSWHDLLSSLDLDVAGPAACPPPAAGPQRLMEDALRAAGFQRFLGDADAAGSPVTVVVNDPSRPTDSRGALDAVMRLADALGLAPRWRLLVATGSHAFPEATRRRHVDRVLGRWGDRFPERRWHDARAGDTLERVGRFRFDDWLAGRGHALAIGSLEPHYFAGLTGAHKALTVGALSLDDLTANHAGALSPRAAPLALEGNPVFDGIVSALSDLETGGARLLALDQVLSDDRVVACTAGAPLDALRRAAPMVHRLRARVVSEPVDLVVARVAPPLDHDLYQADKGVKNVEAGVRDGGIVILDAACPGGVGVDRFLQTLRRAPDHAAALTLVQREGYTLGDHKAVRLRALTDRRGVRIGIVSRSLPDAAARALHAARFDTRSEAAAWALRLLARARSGAGPRPRGLVVECAGNFVLLAAQP